MISTPMTPTEEMVSLPAEGLPRVTSFHGRSVRASPAARRHDRTPQDVHSGGRSGPDAPHRRGDGTERGGCRDRRHAQPARSRRLARAHAGQGDKARRGGRAPAVIEETSMSYKRKAIATRESVPARRDMGRRWNAVRALLGERRGGRAVPRRRRGERATPAGRVTAPRSSGTSTCRTWARAEIRLSRARPVGAGAGVALQPAGAPARSVREGARVAGPSGTRARSPTGIGEPDGDLAMAEERGARRPARRRHRPVLRLGRATSRPYVPFHRTRHLRGARPRPDDAAPGDPGGAPRDLPGHRPPGHRSDTCGSSASRPSSSCPCTPSCTRSSCSTRGSGTTGATTRIGFFAPDVRYRARRRAWRARCGSSRRW